jgi:glucose 1-dehydrogenase/3-oxoacyl-[acyl-carrier protein] reductase
VANAGLGFGGAAADVDDERWQRTLDVNLTGAFRLARAAIPSLVERGGGSIVLVSSVSALVSGTDGAAYVTSKAAMLGLARSIAVDYGPSGIRANALCPGWVETPMGDRSMETLMTKHGISLGEAYRLVTQHIPLRRPATADEIAACCLFLASDESSIVTVCSSSRTAAGSSVGLPASRGSTVIRPRGGSRNRRSSGAGVVAVGGRRAAVAVVDVGSMPPGDRARSRLPAAAVAFDADVRERAEIESARDGALAAFGEIRYLVNNAGLVRMSTFDALEEDEWDLVLDTNLKGMYLVTRAVAPAIAEAGGGAIVNLSTIESEVVVASQGHPQVHYNASKGGVRMLTKALAVELADRSIRVNAVAPGPIATSFIPGGDLRSPEAWAFLKERILVGRVGEPEDVAAAISFLLSDDASFITGAQLAVDGGWLTR